MAPVIRSAYTRAQVAELGRLAELAMVDEALRPCYQRARELVLSGAPASTAARRAIAELKRRRALGADA